MTAARIAKGPHVCTLHAPGSIACHRSHRCECEACLEAARAANRRSQYARDLGRPHYVDAAPVREHIAKLIAAGMSVTQLSELTGIGTGTVSRVRMGTASRVSRKHAAALLRVQPRADLSSGLVDATGTRRRLQALHAIGWSQTALAGEAGGITKQAVAFWEHQDTIHAATRKKVAELYDRLWDKPPADCPAVRRTIAEAKRRGYAVPLAWDDDTIDDPAATPYDEAAEAAEHRERNRVEGVRRWRRHRINEIADLVDMGLSLARVCQRLGLSRDTVYRYCLRDHRLDLWQRMTARDQEALAA